MLAFFRAMAKSKITLVILFLPLFAGLLVFGNVRDVFGTMTAKDAVVSAGDRAVSSAEFKRIFDGAKKEAEQRSGRPLTMEEAVSQGGVEDILESLAGREGFAAALAKAGVRPSDTLVAAQLRKITAFFDPVTGQFDDKLYKNRLQTEGLTSETFERGERDAVAQTHFSTAVAGGLRAPLIYSAVNGALALEQRTFAAFGLDPRSIPAPQAPTDAQLTAFIKAHATELTLPESRSLTVVRFSAAALAPSIAVDPAELQKRFDFRKDTLSAPEKRTVVQVPARDAASAAAAAARLARGEDPAAVAKSLGVDPIVYRDVPLTGISDPRIAQAAFALPAGQVSKPIQGGLAWAVVKVLSITPGRAVTLAEARPALEAELRAETAQDRIYDVVEKYQTVHEGGANLVESARSAGVTALQLPPVSAQGADAAGRPQPMLSEKLLKEAFGLPEGGESEVVDDGKGEYFAVRVDKVFPAHLPTLAADRERLTALYMRNALVTDLRARLEALAERLRKGESIEAVAASVGARVDRATLDRRTAEQDQTQRRDLFAQVFGAKPGGVFTIGAGVVKVEAIKPGSPQDTAMLTRIGAQQLRGGLFQDLGEQTFKWTRKDMKVKLDPARARAALGLAPAEAAPGKAAAK